MRALFINAVCGIGSTGRICIDTAKQLETQGYEVKIAYGRGSVPEKYQKYAVRIGKRPDVYWHALMTKLFDQRGYWSKKATRKFLKWADEYDPDLLWLHNLHDHFINIEMLFEWIKTRPNMQVKWTQHDCWAFTGGCMHFTVNNCYQWKEKCRSCVKGRHKMLRRMEEENFCRKKTAFSGVKDMTIVAVSNWAGRLITQSFLNQYPLEVCYNTVDKCVFKPTESNFREAHGLIDKKVILGVSNVWSAKKGLYDFVELSKILDDRYKIVLVGVSEKLAKKLPKDILVIGHTNNVNELAEIYSTADVFVNPSREETFGMTTLEAVCCGTDVIVYRDTACEEVADLYGGVVVDQSYTSIYEAVKKMFE